MKTKIKKFNGNYWNETPHTVLYILTNVSLSTPLVTHPAIPSHISATINSVNPFFLYHISAFIPSQFIKSKNESFLSLAVVSKYASR